MRNHAILKSVWLLLYVLLPTFVYTTTPLHLDLYYESLCPDCSVFITRQLYPTWNKLKNTPAAFTMSLFPFGNARERELANGTYAYDCQHGEEECKGNFLEICIIKNCDFDPNSYLPILSCVESQVISGHNIEIAVATCVRIF